MNQAPAPSLTVADLLEAAVGRSPAALARWDALERSLSILFPEARHVIAFAKRAGLDPFDLRDVMLPRPNVPCLCLYFAPSEGRAGCTVTPYGVLPA